MAGDAAQAQTVLLLHGPRQAYQITNDYPVPRLVEDDETLIRTHTIGLNPIDWKAPYERIISSYLSLMRMGICADTRLATIETSTLASQHCLTSQAANSPAASQSLPAATPA